MSKRTNKLTLNHYVTFLTNRANRISYYMIGSATIAIPLFALLFILWSLRVNLFNVYDSLRAEGASSDILESLTETILGIKTFELVLLIFFLLFTSLAVLFFFVSIYENYKLEKLMMQDSPISIKKLRKDFNIKAESKFGRLVDYLKKHQK